MQCANAERSIALGRLQSQRDRLIRFMLKENRGRSVNPKTLKKLEEIEMAIEEMARSIYRLD
jgi:hypothetical protein